MGEVHTLYNVSKVLGASTDMDMTVPGGGIPTKKTTGN
jgi:hypothetical protein